MTRYYVYALLFAFVGGLLGCTTNDDIAVYRAELDGRVLEIVENPATPALPDYGEQMREMELTYYEGDLLVQETFVMVPGAPLPDVVMELFDFIDPALLDLIRPIDGVTPIEGYGPPTREMPTEAIAPNGLDLQAVVPGDFVNPDPEHPTYPADPLTPAVEMGELPAQAIEHRAPELDEAMAIDHFECDPNVTDWHDCHVLD